MLRCQISWCLRLDLVLQRLAHACVGQFFFFRILHAIDQLQEALEALIFKLSHKANKKGGGDVSAKEQVRLKPCKNWKLVAYLKVFGHLGELAISVDIADTWPLRELHLQACP